MTSPSLAIAEASAAREQIVPDHSLPQYYYLSPDQYAQDIDVLKRTQWLLVDHESSVGKPGDYVVHELLGESVILTRTKENELEALYNVCRHRGSRVCLEPKGHANLLVCPYHAWAYDLNGSLKAARDMPEGFDRSAHGLRKCHIGIVEGLVFLNLSSSEPPDFVEFSRRFIPFLQRFGISRAKVAHRQLYRTPANWKVVAENNLECYHCVPSHKLLATVNPGLLGNEDEFYRAWSARVEKDGEMIPPFMDGPESQHLQIAGLFGMGAGAISSSIDGQPVAPMMGHERLNKDAAAAQMFNPLSGAGLLYDYTFLMRFIPRGVKETDYEIIWLVDQDAVEGKDYDRERLCEIWDLTTEEDKILTTNNQAGIESSAYSPGPFAIPEFRVAAMTKWYINHFVDGPTPDYEEKPTKMVARG